MGRTPEGGPPGPTVRPPRSRSVRLRPGDLYRERRLLHVRQGKALKDRYVMLSDTALRAVDRYRATIAGPTRWLFPGQRKGRHLTERSVQRVFQRARILSPLDTLEEELEEGDPGASAGSGSDDRS